MQLLTAINRQRLKNEQKPITKEIMIEMLEWFTLDDWNELIHKLLEDRDAG